MRMLVLGAGRQGCACAYDLLRNDAVDHVTIGDIRVDAIPEFLHGALDGPRLDAVRLDARDHEAVLGALNEVDACANALPYYFNAEIARLAVRAGVHYCDLGGNTEIVRRQLELDGEASDRGISVIPDCGLAPGMVNILAAAAIDALDETEAVRIRVGGLPREPEPPLDYQVVYSLEGVLDYYTTPSWVLREGRPTRVEPLSEIEEVEFPEPIGTLEAFHTAGGLSTMPWSYEGRIPTMEYKTLRYPGHARIMRAIRDLGLLEKEAVRAGGCDVSPRDVFIACAGPRLERPDARDLVALRVEADGRADGQRRHIAYDLLDHYDEAAGISAMERTTGFSLSVIAQMQADDRIDRLGVRTPDWAVPPESYIDELDRRGIRIRRRIG